MFTLLISAEQLSSQLSSHHKPIIFDCRFDLQNLKAGYETYNSAHIPTAFYLDLEQDLSGTKTGLNGRHPLPEQTTLAEKLRAYGVSDTSQIIAYDAQGGIFAARLWWLLRWLGHENIAVLDGGIQAWTAAGYCLTQEVMRPQPGNFSIRPALQSSVPVSEVINNLKNKTDLVIDARSPDRFRGENETLDPVGGHIPHAINHFFKNNLQENGHFKSTEDLKKDWLPLLGNRTADQTIHQCGSGVTACHNLLALEVAGLKGAKLYAGSWSEWCSDASRPLAVG
ncbi:MAG: sulfurtransferase [Pseudomonadota bacterium]